MSKDLLSGIVDRETGDLLDRKGQHVKKRGAEDEKSARNKGGGTSDTNGVKLALALLLVACAVGALIWSFTSMSSSTDGIRAYGARRTMLPCLTRHKRPSRTSVVRSSVRQT
jgi:hypothetical protein